MTDKEKLKKIKSLADKMSDTAFNMTTDVGLLRKAMDEYHQFIINEYHKEEHAIEELEDACKLMAEDARKNKSETFNQFFSQTDYKQGVMDGANWRIAKLLENAIDVIVHIDAGGYPYIPQLELYKAKEGDKYKVILIKED